ncbi:MAG: hypothetical protein QNL62_17540, partial [Gammaproteobacteria bacterium]|nr:hypothetical protein [Gammaproteobacteria bacterium]
MQKFYDDCRYFITILTAYQANNDDRTEMVENRFTGVTCWRLFSRDREYHNKSQNGCHCGKASLVQAVGYAFVMMGKEAALKAVEALNESEYQKRILKVRIAKPRNNFPKRKENVQPQSI